MSDTAGLTYRGFCEHLRECGLLVTRMPGYPNPESVRIRGEQGDSLVAAIHLENGALVIDVGVRVRVREEAT